MQPWLRVAGLAALTHQGLLGEDHNALSTPPSPHPITKGVVLNFCFSEAGSCLGLQCAAAPGQAQGMWGQGLVLKESWEGEVRPCQAEFHPFSTVFPQSEETLSAARHIRWATCPCRWRSLQGWRSRCCVILPQGRGKPGRCHATPLPCLANGSLGTVSSWCRLEQP